MAEGNSCRSILGDVTNLLGKRGLSDFTDNDKVRRSRLCTGINSLKGNVISNISKISNQIRDSNFLDLKGSPLIDLESDGCGRLDLLKENTILAGNVIDLTKIGDGKHAGFGSSKGSPCVIVETKEELGGIFSTDSQQTMSETYGDCLRDGKSCDGVEIIGSLQCTKSDEEDHHADNFVLSQSGSIDGPFLPDSQESRVFGIDGSSELKKGEKCANMNAGIDSIKACSCSFCTKAGFIWLDLNYQDIKARVSAIKKSQKEATILAERSCRNKAPAESSTRVPKLESNLRYQWRSLFQHMSGIWEGESNQLEANLLPLSEMREKCKTELKLNKATMEKH